MIKTKPVPGQRTPFVDEGRLILPAWFAWLKGQADIDVEISTTLDHRSVKLAFLQSDDR